MVNVKEMLKLIYNVDYLLKSYILAS